MEHCARFRIGCVLFINYYMSNLAQPDQKNHVGVCWCKTSIHGAVPWPRAYVLLTSAW